MEITHCQKKIRTLTILGIITALLVLLNSTVFFVRFDFSKGRVFSVSSFSEQVLSELPEQVHIAYYVSDKMKTLYPGVKNAIDFLYDYAFASRGAVTVEIIEPEKEKLETVLQSMNILPEQMQVVEKNQTSFVNVYSTIVIEYLDDIKIIPFVIDSTSLEYELTNRIMSFIHHMPKEVYVLLGSNSTLETEYPYVPLWLENGGYTYQVITDVSATVLTDITKPLLVLGSSQVDAQEVQEIERFMLRGGNAVFFVSSYSSEIFTDWRMTENTYNELPILLETYGVILGSELLLDVSNYRLTMQTLETNTTGQQYQYIQYPFWIITLNSFASKYSPITGGSVDGKTTGGFSGLELYWANPLYIDERDGNHIEILTQTTPSAWLMTQPFNTDPFASPLASKNPSSVAQYNTSVSVETAHNRFVVVSDQYVPSVMIEYSNSPHNMDFMMNTILWVSGENELLTLKNKVIFDTRLTKITDENEFAFVQHLTYITVFGIIPLTILICALLVFMWRRKK